MNRSTLHEIILAISIFFSGHHSFSQDTTRLKKIKILPVPVFGYTPETGTYIGAVTLFNVDLYQDRRTRTSNAKVEINYTWEKQLILESEWNYFFKEETWLSKGLLHYSKYPDLYYGIGENTPDTVDINFESNRIKMNINLLKNINTDLFIGGGIKYCKYSNVEYQDEHIYYPELEDRSNVGINFIFLKDSRNNILTPVNGTYIEFINTFNFSLNNYDQTIFDIRKYYSWGLSKNQTFAGRFYNSLVFGEPPFYDYSLIGGDKYARGYFYGRFRDNNFSSLQVEYRLNMIWRFGLATFGGLSMIYSDYTNINQDNFKPNAGIGLRFLVDRKENTNLRFDYAIGSKGQSGFYVSFGESF
ncbi:hypothetical protein ACFLU5_14045 [Bacteroidota bacterium]